jgi:tetratricopeptide (TPR) repeat protein
VTRLRVRLLMSALFFTTLARGAEPDETSSTQAVDDARRADAKERYEQGVEAYKAGRFKDAVDFFLAADRLSPSAPLSFNIARAYEKLGDDSGALRWYRDYIRRAPDAANANDVMKSIGHFEERLSKKGVQQLTVLSTPAGATVSIDGANLGVTPGTFDLPPGTHQVVLILRGYRDASSAVDLAPDRAQDLAVGLTPAAAASEPSTPLPAAGAAVAAPVAPSKPSLAPAATWAGFGPWPWVTVGAGVAALGGALTFELLRQSAEHDAEHATTQIDYANALDLMESRRTTARVLTGVGGALVVAGGVLLTIELAHGKPERAASIRVMPLAGGTLTTIGGSF